MVSFFVWWGMGRKVVNLIPKCSILNLDQEPKSNAWQNHFVCCMELFDVEDASSSGPVSTPPCNQMLIAWLGAYWLVRFGALELAEDVNDYLD